MITVRSGRQVPAALDADTNGVAGAGSLHSALNTVLASAAALGVAAVRLSGHAYDLSGGHVLVPAGVTLLGSGPATVLNGGAFAVVSDGHVADLTFGTGWTYFSGDTVTPTGYGAALIGGTVANVVTTPGVELWPTRRPHNNLPRTLARLRTTYAFKRTKVSIFSDSLSWNGSGSGVAWPNLLFDDTYLATTGAAYNVTGHFGSNNVTLTDRAIPGSTPHIQTAYLAYEHAATDVGDRLDDQIKGAEAYTSPPQIADIDLAIICEGRNGGTGLYQHLENLVAALRRQGTEVILVTQSPDRPVSASTGNKLWRLHQIAAAYGCAVADSFAYTMREILTGRSTATALTDTDTVHPNQAGWNLYAQAVLDCLRDQQSGAAPTRAHLPARRVVVENTNTASLERWGNAFGAQFAPVTASGGVTYDTPVDTTRSPLIGRRASLTNTVMVVPSGQYVDFAPIDAYDVTLILEATSTAGAGAIKVNNGATTLQSFSSSTATPVPRLMQIAVVSGTWAAAALRSRHMRVEATSGTLRIVGIVWSTVGKRWWPRASDGSFRDVTLSGTWGVQAGPWFGVSNIPYTDTTASYAQFDFVGDGVLVKVGKSPSGGVLRVTVDGVQESGTVDTYTAGAEAIMNIVRTNLVYGRHRIRIAYEFTNGSASAAGGGSRGARRLTLYEIAALDSRMNAAESDLTRPASDLIVAEQGDTGPQGATGETPTVPPYGPPFRSGSYVYPPVVTGTLALVLGRRYYVPVDIPDGTATATELTVDVTTAATGSSGGLLRMGIYADDGEGMPTGSPIVDAGTISSEGSNNARTITISQAVSAARVHLALQPEVAACTVRATTGISPWAQITAKVDGATPNFGGHYEGSISAGPLTSVGVTLSPGQMPLMGVKVT